MTQHGIFYWNELMTPDVEGARAFYGETLGWTFEPFEMEGSDSTYWVCKAGDTAVGGIFDTSNHEAGEIPPHWFSHIAVDDVDARVEKALACSGTLMRPVFDVAGVGRIAILKDPTGGVVGWITPVEQDQT